MHNKYSSWDVGGDIAKQDERYIVKDNTILKNLVVSSTELNPLFSTSGHSHPGQEEVYLFLDGDGVMQLDDIKFDVKKGDTVLIKDGVFHRVFAGEKGCRFTCVFDGARQHK